MFEEAGFDEVLQRMLERAPADVDTREGSVLWNVLAPAALEICNLYVEMDELLSETFADTAGRDFLIRRAAERGMKPQPPTPTNAILRGQFNCEIPIGSRFSLEEFNYEAVERTDDGGYRMRCETPGAAGNRLLGQLIPIAYIDGLTSARLTGVLIPGEEAEETEKLRRRYLDGFKMQAFGGNVADYKEKVNALAGVGGVRVEPVWNGGGTVRLTVIGSDGSAPSGELVRTVQEAVDPEGNAGQGLGLAPIGHLVTVRGVRGRPLEIAVRMSFREGWSWPMVQARAQVAAEVYFAELAGQWAGAEATVVRVSQLETRLLALEGVLDVGGLTLDGVGENLVLRMDEIPVRGGMSCA